MDSTRKWFCIHPPVPNHPQTDFNTTKAILDPQNKKKEVTCHFHAVKWRCEEFSSIFFLFRLLFYEQQRQQRKRLAKMIMKMSTRMFPVIHLTMKPPMPKSKTPRSSPELIPLKLWFAHLNIYWHERRRCSPSPSGGRLATTLVDRYFPHYFFHFPCFLLRRDLFS